MDESVSFLSSLQCYYFALVYIFIFNPFVCFFSCAFTFKFFGCFFFWKQETLNCQKLHSSLRRHRAQPRSNSANRSSFPQPAGERGLSLLSHRFFFVSSSSSSSSSPPPPPSLSLLFAHPSCRTSGMDVYTGKRGLMYVCMYCTVCMWDMGVNLMLSS